MDSKMIAIIHLMNHFKLKSQIMIFNTPSIMKDKINMIIQAIALINLWSKTKPNPSLTLKIDKSRDNYHDVDQLHFNDKISHIDINNNPSIIPTPLDSPVKEKTALPPIHKDNKDTLKISLNFKNTSNIDESKPK